MRSAPAARGLDHSDAVVVDVYIYIYIYIYIYMSWVGSAPEARDLDDSDAVVVDASSSSSSSLLLSSLELSDTPVYEPHTRALLGTDSHFCEVVVLKWIG